MFKRSSTKSFKRDLKYVAIFIVSAFAFPLNILLVVLVIKRDNQKDLAVSEATVN